MDGSRCLGDLMEGSQWVVSLADLTWIIQGGFKQSPSRSHCDDQLLTRLDYLRSYTELRANVFGRLTAPNPQVHTHPGEVRQLSWRAKSSHSESLNWRRCWLRKLAVPKWETKACGLQRDPPQSGSPNGCRSLRKQQLFLKLCCTGMASVVGDNATLMICVCSLTSAFKQRRACDLAIIP